MTQTLVASLDADCPEFLGMFDITSTLSLVSESPPFCPCEGSSHGGMDSEPDQRVTITIPFIYQAFLKIALALSSMRGLI